MAKKKSVKKKSVKKGKGRRERKKFDFSLLVVIALVVLIFVTGYYYKEILLAPVVEGPPTMQQFYGDISWNDGTPIGEEVQVYVVADGEIIMDVVALDSKYGYNPRFLIENFEEDTVLEFHLNLTTTGSEPDVVNVGFENLKLTNLDLYFDICGDGDCASERYEDCSSCSADCGSCPPPSGGSTPGSSGGSTPGSSGGSTGLYRRDVTNVTVIGDSEELQNVSDEPVEVEEPTVLGDKEEDGEKSKAGFYLLLIGLMLLIILIFVVLALILRKVLRNKRQGQGNQNLVKPVNNFGNRTFGGIGQQGVK